MKKILWLVLVVIIGVGVYFSFPSMFQNKSATLISENIPIRSPDEQKSEIKSFTKLLIDKVLKAEKEVSLEDREKLEASIASLNDKELSNLWRTFVGSDTQAEAESNLWNLLEGLIEKM